MRIYMKRLCTFSHIFVVSSVYFGTVFMCHLFDLTQSNEAWAFGISKATPAAICKSSKYNQLQQTLPVWSCSQGSKETKPSCKLWGGKTYRITAVFGWKSKRKHLYGETFHVLLIFTLNLWIAQSEYSFIEKPHLQLFFNQAGEALRMNCQGFDWLFNQSHNVIINSHHIRVKQLTTNPSTISSTRGKVQNCQTHIYSYET